jgi:heat shock protein HslJ
MKRFFYILTVSLFAVAMIACNTGRGGNKLTAHQWQLDEIVYADSLYSVTPPTDVTVSFSDSLTVSGMSGCNRFVGTYEADENGKLSIAINASTEAACLWMEFEAQYINLLKNATKYEVGGAQGADAIEADDTLEVFNGDGSATLIFKPVFE